MFTLDDNHIVKQEAPLDFYDVFKEKSVLFKDIFNSTNEKLHQQMQRYKGLDHPFEVGERQLLIDNNEFELKVETDMPHMVIYTFNEPQIGIVISIFINLILDLLWKLKISLMISTCMVRSAVYFRSTYALSF